MRHEESRPAGGPGGSQKVYVATESSVPRLSAGVTLRAADALRNGQETFTADQVAYLLHLAYESGRTATYLGDLAELYANWEAHRHEWQRTAEQRRAERRAVYDRYAAESGRPPYYGGPVDFETGRPLRRPEPYTSPENGTALTVDERDALGRLAA